LNKKGGEIMRYIEAIWGRQLKESIQAYEAFKTYMNLGSSRSLKLVRRILISPYQL